MRKYKRLTEEQTKVLKQSPVVENVTLVGATYKYEFKLKAIELYEQGYGSEDIFAKYGITVNEISKEQMQKIIAKWRYLKRNNLLIKYDKSKRHNNNHNNHNNNRCNKECCFKGNKITNQSLENIGNNSSYTDEDIKKIIARNNYLEAENDFLKKLKALEEQFG